MKKLTFMLVFAAFAAFLLSGAQAAETAEIDDRQAMDILQKMARTLAGAEQFSVTVRSSYDAPQANGQMVEFGSIREIQIKSPDKLRVDVQKSDGDLRIQVLTAKRSSSTMSLKTSMPGPKRSGLLMKLSSTLLVF